MLTWIALFLRASLHLAPEWRDARANALRLLEEGEPPPGLLRFALAEGEADGDAGALGFDEIRRTAREWGADA